MKITFIAHAGFCIQEGETQVLVDPWFWDSTQDFPVIESIGGGFKTIDFQIPKTTENIGDYAPDVILVSHFHPHHSPLRDILRLAENSFQFGKSVSILHPRSGEDAEESLKKNIPSTIHRAELLPHETFSIGSITIQATPHTVPGHNGWSIASPTASVLHVADAKLNRDSSVRRADDIWLTLRDMSPDVFFTSAGGHSVRTKSPDGTKRILDAECLSAIEAAQVVALVKPRAAGIMGLYNHSIWKKRLEYILDAPIAEEQFQWAISWLDQDIKQLYLRPGHTIAIGDEGPVDTFTTHLTSR